MNWVTLLTTVLAGLLSAGGTASIVVAIANRRKVRAEVADRLNDSTLEWAQALQADAREARMEAREARMEAAEMRREASEMRRQINDLAAELRALHRAISEPTATIERLRQVIANGRQ